MEKEDSQVEYSWDSLPEHIREKLVLDGGCWIYTGELNRNGYGTFRRTVARGKRKRFMVHIETYKHFKGEYDPGLYLDHGCVRPACCNPAHLEAVTPLVNTQRGSSHMFKKAEEYEMPNLQQ